MTEILSDRDIFLTNAHMKEFNDYKRVFNSLQYIDDGEPNHILKVLNIIIYIVGRIEEETCKQSLNFPYLFRSVCEETANLQSIDVYNPIIYGMMGAYAGYLSLPKFVVSAICDERNEKMINSMQKIKHYLEYE